MAAPPRVPDDVDGDEEDREEKRRSQEELQRQRVEGVFLSPTSLLSPSSLASSDFFFGAARSTPLAVRAPWATPPVASLDSQILSSSSSPPLSGAEATPPTRNSVARGTQSSPLKEASVYSPESDFDLHDLGSGASSSTPTPRGSGGSGGNAASASHSEGRAGLGGVLSSAAASVSRDRDRERSVMHNTSAEKRKGREIFLSDVLPF